VLITAGPTFEAIDPVRGITNHSSGKMGFAIARAAPRPAPGHAGGRPGAPAHAAPRGAHRRASAREMLMPRCCRWRRARRLRGHRGRGRLAAGGGRRAQDQEGRQRPPPLRAGENPDILAAVAACRPGQRPGAWALPPRATTWSATRARSCERKGVPLIVGNLGPATFGRDDNALLLVDAEGEHGTARRHKLSLARELVAEIAAPPAPALR
jgi:phosphopantothenoylcysteine decarboxylase / phosphopantothenate---cysteine ligase